MSIHLALVLGPALAQGLEPGPAPPAEGLEVPRETSIYIPYTKLREVFERQGRGVFLPYEQFRALWEAARPAPRPPEPGPPAEALIAETLNEATVTRDVLSVEAIVRIEVLKAGWVQVPLRLKDAAIMAATIGTEPARLAYDPQDGHTLLYERPDSAAGTVELHLRYAKAIAKAPGRNSVVFDPPQAPVSRWHISIPEPGVEVDIDPLVAATRLPQAPAGNAAANAGGGQADAGQTQVLAFVGPAPAVRIAWTPRAEGAAGMVALVHVQSMQQVAFEEGVIRIRSDLDYDIARSALERLVLEVPATYKVANVTDANVRRWVLEEAQADRQRIVVELFEPARGRQAVRLELERFLGDAPGGDFEVPVVAAVDAGRQEAVLAVRLGEGLRAEVRRTTALVQMNAQELPGDRPEGGWAFAYRTLAIPFELVLAVEKARPRIDAQVRVQATLQPEELSEQVKLLLDVQQAGVFELELAVPQGAEVRRVGGEAVDGAEPAQVDAHHLAGDAGTTLVVKLARRAIGKTGLALELVRRLEEPDLLAPTGRSVALEIGIPRLVGESVRRQSGRIVLAAPEALRVNVSRTESLPSIPLEEVQAEQAQAQAPAPETPRPVLAFASADPPALLAVAVQRRQPEVVVRQLLLVHVEPGAVRFDATFTYDVRFSGVQSLRVDVPAELAESIRNLTAGVREEAIDPPPQDVAPGCVAWRFTGQREFFREAKLHLAWQRELAELEAGKSVEIKVPRLEPRQVDRAWGQVVLTRSETLDARPDRAERVRAIDPRHDLMAGAAVSGAASACEFHDRDWSLDVAITRYEPQAIKRTSIERALVRMVVTRSGQVGVQGLHRVRSARQRLRVELPPGAAFDTEPLRIDGQGVTLERGEGESYFIPLVGQGADAPHLIELRYAMGDYDGDLPLPDFPEDPAMQKVYLSVYLPEDVAMLGSTGPWTGQMSWRARGLLGWRSRPVPWTDEQRLIEWVTADMAVDRELIQTFQTDGQRLLFASLRPAPRPQGTLHVTAMDETWRRVLVFLVLVAAGVALLRAAAPWRWLAVGAALVALTLIGVFMPTLALNLLDGVTAAALFVVLVLWTVQARSWRRLRRQPSDLGTPVAVGPGNAGSSTPPDRPGGPGGPTHA